MIFHILVTVFFFGFALLIGILNVMRGLYSFSICQPPLIPSDSAAKVSLDEDHEQTPTILVTGGLSPIRNFDRGDVDPVRARLLRPGPDLRHTVRLENNAGSVE